MDEPGRARRGCRSAGLIGSDARLSRLASSITHSNDPSHDELHVLRVAEWTLRLIEGVDPIEAVAAALLHDLVAIEKSSKDRPRASELSATAAAPLLTEVGFDEAATGRICEAIRTCSFSRGEVPRSALGRALADADALDALGAIGVLRTATTGARMGARYYDPDDPFAEDRPLDDKRQTVDHFYTKLFALPARMNTDTGRNEAARRVEVMRAFLIALGTEIG